MKIEGLPSVDKGIITLSGEIGKDMKEILFLKKAIASLLALHSSQRNNYCKHRKNGVQISRSCSWETEKIVVPKCDILNL